MTKLTSMKRLFKLLLAVLFALVIAIILTPILFKSELIQAVKEHANDNINAEVDFDDINISLFKSFPKVSLQIEDLFIKSKMDIDDKPLLESSSIELTTDLKSLIKSSDGLRIYKFRCNDCEANILVDKNGYANYDIQKAQASTQENNLNIFGSIDGYEIKNGTLTYTDKVSDMSIEIKSIQHSGFGAFSNTIFDLNTETNIDELNVEYNGVHYLKKRELKSRIALEVDSGKKSYTFKENQSYLDDLEFKFLGTIAQLTDGFDMDLSFDAPNNEVKSLLSLLPAFVMQDYKSFNSSGNGTFRGNINGVYNSTLNQFPGINIDIQIEDGNVKNPQYPFPLENIDLEMNINSKDQNWNDLTLDLKKGSFVLNGQEMFTQLSVKNILGNSKIDGRAKGKIDLNDFSQFINTEEYAFNEGIIELDGEIIALKNDILNNKYDNITFKGFINTNNIKGRILKNFKFENTNSEIVLSPEKIDILGNNILIDGNDINARIKIENPLYFLSDSLHSDIIVNTESKTINFSELKNKYLANSSGTTTQDSINQSYDIPFLTINSKVDNIIYDNYDIKNVNVNLLTRDNSLRIDNAALLLDNERVSFRANFDNIIAYLNNTGSIEGKVFIEADELDANRYILNDESINNENATAPYKVDEKFNLEIYPKVNTLIYGKHTFKNMEGKISLSEGIASLTEGRTKLFNGQIAFEGEYDSRDIDNPLFNFKYNMDKLEFQRMFEASSTFKALTPVAKYINGIFNSTLVISGPLKNDMFPDLTKINASGFLETVRGKIVGLDPLEKLSEALNIKEIKNWDIKDSRNWFDVKDGVVYIKPNEYVFEDMKFIVEGNHALDQTIDYIIKAQIPREKLNDVDVGNLLESGMKTLEQAASSRGVRLDLGEQIFLDIYLTGQLTNPKIKIVPVGSGGKTLKEVVKDKVEEEIDNLRDTVTQELENKTEELKDTITAVVENTIDTVTSEIKEEIKEKTDSIKSDLEDKIKDEVKETIDSTILGTVKDSLGNELEDKVSDILKDTGKDEIDSLKSVLNDWNPFKKKKKN